MVSSTGSQVESAIFQRVIGSLGSTLEFGANVDVDFIEEDLVRVGDGGVEDVVGNLSGQEHTEEGAAQAVVDD